MDIGDKYKKNILFLPLNLKIKLLTFNIFSLVCLFGGLILIGTLILISGYKLVIALLIVFILTIPFVYLCHRIQEHYYDNFFLSKKVSEERKIECKNKFKLEEDHEYALLQKIRPYLLKNRTRIPSLFIMVLGNIILFYREQYNDITLGLNEALEKKSEITVHEVLQW